MKSPIFSTLALVFISAVASAGGWNMENGPAVAALKSIQEGMPNYVEKDGSCNTVDLTTVVKLSLNSTVNKLDLNSVASDLKNAPVLDLSDKEKDCLTKAVRTLYDDRSSASAVPVQLLDVVNVSFALKIEKTKAQQK